MKNSLEHIKTIDEWRNCPMANFICSVSRETGIETNTPRGKMLVLSLLCNGSRTLEKNVVNRIYECCLCGLCTQCGFDDTDIPAAIRAARADICEAGVLPEEIKAFGEDIQKDCVWGDEERVTALIPSDKKTVFITSDKENAANFEVLAQKAGIDVLVICEGRYDSALLDEIGMRSVSRQYIGRINRFSENQNVDTVVVDSPHLWSLLNKNTAGKKYTALTEFVLSLVEAGRLKFGKAGESVTYHDPCRLVRNMPEETAVRGILDAAGIKVFETRWNKKDAKCCGGSALKITAKDIQKKITKRRIDEITATGADRVLVSCSHCYDNFKECDPDLKVVKFLDLILSVAS
ncbi:MAG: (Fe-S)-binding protein [Eubacteriales bacterium]|nr:(Fe-S)-binding protein [Eubacteriales bacterium]